MASVELALYSTPGIRLLAILATWVELRLWKLRERLARASRDSEIQSQAFSFLTLFLTEFLKMLAYPET